MSRVLYIISALLNFKMSKPCSQLNSKLIRDKAECSIIAKVEKQCSVVGFKCVWRVKDQEIENALELDLRKTRRVQCDLKLSKVNGDCFFFSSISTSKLDTKKRKTPQRSQALRESDDSSDESTISASQLSSPGKKVFPAISYWVLACQTPNGSAMNPLKLQSAREKDLALPKASRPLDSRGKYPVFSCRSNALEISILFK